VSLLVGLGAPHEASHAVGVPLHEVVDVERAELTTTERPGEPEEQERAVAHAAQSVRKPCHHGLHGLGHGGRLPGLGDADVAPDAAPTAR
jgi:hypothetical protein